jgi:DNA-directed RNA polymerase subunit RPC12/RpoP
MLKLPGGKATERNPAQPSASGSPARSAEPTEPESHQGITNLSLVCPTCGTRLYATSGQVGESIVCPDCLESVVVKPPARVPRPPTPPRQPAPPAQPPRAARGRAGEGQAPEEEEEFRLGDPIELPRDHLLPKAISELLRRAAPGAQGDAAAAGPGGSSSSGIGSDPGPRAKRPDAGQAEPGDRGEPSELFRVRCPVCDTYLDAFADEVGQTRTCPDCYSEVLIQRPKPTAKGAQRVNPLDQEGGDFTLGEAADLSVYRQHLGERRGAITDPSIPAGLLEKARQAQIAHELNQPRLPDRPLWTGVLQFLLDIGVLARAASIVLFLSAAILLGFRSLVWMEQGGTSQFLSLLALVLAVILLLFWYAFTSATALYVLQQSSDGIDRTSEWPDVDFAEWIVEGLFILAAMFYALGPGMALGWFWSLADLPAWGRLLLAACSLFLLYPIVQLSLLEGASLSTPLTRPILASVREDRDLWMTFYAQAAGLVLVLVVLGMFLPLGTGPSTVLVVTLWTLGLLIYYRLLGRLAWACQARHWPDDKADAEDES